MTTKNQIEHFLKQKDIAIAGVSRDGKNIGNAIFKELKGKDYNLFQINPNADEINGEVCYRSFQSIQENVSAVIMTVKPEQSLQVVKDAHAKGIKNIWMQLGSGSEEAIKFCQENDINYISNECIFMFAEPVESIHKFHKWVWKLIGKLPKN
ncbi:MAG: CoA-binding protein [Bacteroidetes bacterium]|nr:CoA-binding protein [Bacteroidota bacterium]